MLLVSERTSRLPACLFITLSCQLEQPAFTQRFFAAERDRLARHISIWMSHLCRVLAERRRSFFPVSASFVNKRLPNLKHQVSTLTYHRVLWVKQLTISIFIVHHIPA